MILLLSSHFRDNPRNRRPCNTALSTLICNPALSTFSYARHYIQLIVNDRTDSGTNTLDVIVTFLSQRTACTVNLHFCLPAAHIFSSLHESVCGASIKMSPSLRQSYRHFTAGCRSLYSSSLKMWTSHCSRRARIHVTRSNVLHFAEASWCGVLPVITLII